MTNKICPKCKRAIIEHREKTDNCLFCGRIIRRVEKLEKKMDKVMLSNFLKALNDIANEKN